MPVPGLAETGTADLAGSATAGVAETAIAGLAERLTAPVAVGRRRGHSVADSALTGMLSSASSARSAAGGRPSVVR